jgi:GT2 family glycosyltransferase
MKLSLIIVNNHWKSQLKQTLLNLSTACKDIDYEFFILDSDIQGKAIEFAGQEFSNLNFLNNNFGGSISRAYNEALKLCSGEYILMVSADTISGKDSLEKMVSFMDTHPDASGLSARILSPQGRFLSQSIHGLNNSWAIFFKLVGFAKQLSKTRLYNRNRKDWVEEFQVSEIDILNSQCMLLRRSVLNQVGFFDERFVKYGFNIDLSYRMRLAGFKNYYFPKTYFISTDADAANKFSWDYIKYFYGAMAIFAFKYLIRVPEIKVQDIPQLIHSTYEVKG